ncbi:hypothetical protein P8452_41769 [Trifolium repens]|nr:hypothetical protein P8452_41769 [Trifolium repens]
MILDYQPFFTPSPGKNGEVVQHIMDVATMKIPENFKAVLHELVLWYLKARYQVETPIHLFMHFELASKIWENAVNKD